MIHYNLQKLTVLSMQFTSRIRGITFELYCIRITIITNNLLYIFHWLTRDSWSAISRISSSNNSEIKKIEKIEQKEDKTRSILRPIDNYMEKMSLYTIIFFNYPTHWTDILMKTKVIIVYRT